MLRFKAGITAADLNIIRSGAHLILGIKGTTDQVTVQGFFANNIIDHRYGVDRIEFADGSTLSDADISAVLPISTSGNDTIWTLNTDDTINAGDGDDVVYAAGGSDIINGDAGADTLYAGAGNDAVSGGVDNDTLYAEAGDDAVDGGAGNDRVDGGDGVDTLEGGTGNDQLYGGAGNDALSAGTGADALYGEAGDDTLDGGAGNDGVVGGTGNDTYLFGRGDGQDIIYNSQVGISYGNITDPVAYPYPQSQYLESDQATTTDVLRFKAGITAADLNIIRSGAHLILGIKGTTDQVTVQGFFANNIIDHRYGVDRIEFADGTTLSDTAVWAGVSTSTLPPSGPTTTINGTAGNDNLAGTSDSNTINGLAGNDTLDGGAGNDLLQGGTGSDTYLFGRGDGQDTLRNATSALSSDPNNYLYQPNYGTYYAESDYSSAVDTLKFKEGIAAADLNIVRNGAHLILGIKGTTDQITIEGFFALNNISHIWGVDRIEFADGSTLSDADISALVPISTSGNDTIWTLNTDDTINAGDGDDTVYVAGGNDIINGDAGSDTIYAGAGNDAVSGGADNDILYGEAGDDTVDGGAGSDRVDGGDGVDVLEGDAGNDQLFGGAGNDTLSGSAGTDNLYGEAGNDTLDGGAGNDLLQGGTGSDTYLFGRGDGQDTLRNATSALSSDPNNYLYQPNYGTYYAESDYSSAVDTLKFKEGIAAADLNIVRNGAHLILGIKGTTDQITIEGFFALNNISHIWGVDRIEFADGSTLSDADISALVPISTSGNDTIWTLNTDDTINAGDGDDTVYVADGNDIINGDAGSDTIYAGAGNDAVSGGADNDTLYGEAGDDTVDGGAGSDRVDGGDGVDVLEGDAGNDQLFGGAGNDTLSGSAGTDNLYGEAGNDTLDGGAGNDLLQGGTGSDTYLFGRGFSIRRESRSYKLPPIGLRVRIEFAIGRGQYIFS